MLELAKLLEDKEFLRMNKELCGFNLFEVIGFQHQENTHSKFLAFLLTPGESHGLQQDFLRGFIELANKSGLSFPADPDLGESVVTCEEHLAEAEGRLDIFIKIPKRKIILIIENKVEASEGEGQTKNT